MRTASERPMIGGIMTWRNFLNARPAWLRPVALVLMLYVPCSSRGQTVDLESVFLQLDFIINAQYAGHAVAEDRGFYADEGLHVIAAELVGEGPPVVSRVVDLTYAIGSTFSFDFFRKRAAGAPIRMIGSMFDVYPNGWMYLRSSGIESVKDLRGKRIGVTDPNSALMTHLLELAGIERDELLLVKIPPEANRAGLILNGEVDVTMGWLNDEFATLQTLSAGKGAFMLMHDFGYEGWGQVIFTTETMIAERPEALVGFLRAHRRGWDAAMNDPEAATLSVLRAHAGQDPAIIRSSFEAMERLVRPSGVSLAPLEIERLQAAIEQLESQGSIPAGLTLEDVYDGRFISP